MFKWTKSFVAEIRPNLLYDITKYLVLGAISLMVAAIYYLNAMVAGLPRDWLTVALIFLASFGLMAIALLVAQIGRQREAVGMVATDQGEAATQSQSLPSGQTEVEKALILKTADFNNLQQKYDRLNEAVGGKKQQFKTQSQHMAELLALKSSTELALAKKESEIASLKQIDVQKDLYVTVRVRFDKLLSDNTLEFQVHVFNGSPRGIFIECDLYQNNVKGFIVVGDAALPKKPILKNVHQFEPPNRLTVLTIEQQLAPESAKELDRTLSEGTFVQFMFNDLDLYMAIEDSSEKRRLPLPGGVDCQKGICSNRIVTGKAVWTLPGLRNK